MQEYNRFKNQKYGEYESDETQKLLNKYQKEHQLQQGQNKQEMSIKDKKEKILKSKMNDPFEQVLIDEKYNPIGKKVKRNIDAENNQQIQLQQHKQEKQQKEISKFLQINQQQQQDFKNVENSKVFLDIMIQNQIQKIVIELFDKIVPKTAQNFRALCTGEYGFSFQNNIFHRVIPNFMAQGGDITHNNGQGGKSIYGQKFQDENFKIKHDKPYLLSMANSGPNSNGSQFFITFKECPWLDGKHVVFGKVIQGFNTIKQMEQFGDQTGQPLTKIIIKNCGIYENVQQEQLQNNEQFLEKYNNIQQNQDIEDLQKLSKFIPRQIKQSKKIDQLLNNFEQKLHQQQENQLDQEDIQKQQEQAYLQQEKEQAYLQQEKEQAYLQQQLQIQLQQDRMKLQQQEIKKDQQINKKKIVFDYSDSDDDNEQQQFQPTQKPQQVQQEQQDSDDDDLSGSILDYIDEQYNSDEI